jgi:TPR repeat protein
MTVTALRWEGLPLAEEKKKISAKEIVGDIRAGATDEFLMKKYGISEKALQGLFQKLVAAKFLTQADVDRRGAVVDEVDLVDSASLKDKSLDTLRVLCEKLKISSEDLEKLKTASLKDIKEFIDKRNLSLRDAKELFKSLGISTGNLLSQTAGKIKDGTQQLRDELKQKQASGDQSAANAALEMTQEKLKKAGDQAVEKAKELQEKVSAEAAGLVSKFNVRAWFETMWILIITLLLLYPVGLHGLWKTTRFSPKTKAIIAVAFLVVNLAIGAKYIQQLLGLWSVLGLAAGIYAIWMSSLSGTTKKIASAGTIAVAAIIVCGLVLSSSTDWNYRVRAERILKLANTGTKAPFREDLSRMCKDPEAMKWFHRNGEQGQAVAQTILGLMYYHGIEVSKDYAEAMKWFRKAADNGNAYAQSGLGVMHLYGQGVTKNQAEAVKWFRKAADNGNVTCQFTLGVMYHGGENVPKDYAEALKWYVKAADQGDSGSQFFLGFMHFRGQGVPEDHSKAVKWWKKAADQGNPNAQNNLGAMYGIGLGVPKDYAEAVKWWKKAADQGNANAQRNLKARDEDRQTTGTIIVTGLDDKDTAILQTPSKKDAEVTQVAPSLNQVAKPTTTPSRDTQQDARSMQEKNKQYNECFDPCLQKCPSVSAWKYAFGKQGITGDLAESMAKAEKEKCEKKCMDDCSAKAYSQKDIDSGNCLQNCLKQNCHRFSTGSKEKIDCMNDYMNRCKAECGVK